MFMALLKCNDCGKDVSTEAEACPHCGCPQKEEQVGVPKCPTCNSKEVEKISVGAKLTTVFLWGRPDNLIRTFKCKKCGHRW